MAERDHTFGISLERYQLLEEVGHGGMAVVYKGLDTTLNREVAVKVLHPHLAGMAESRARLQREAHAVAKLRHENILEIFDYSGPDSPDCYIVTELIHGQTLKSFLAEHPLPFPEVAEMVVSEVGRALEHAHSLGVIHRDIKPENVMIRDDGLIKLMDFGIAQIVDKERMTVTGQLLGSPAYMAPEHVEGKPLDFRTDVFALGILLYQLATGQLPFRGKNPHEVLKKIAECTYLPPERVNPLIGARLSRTIAQALKRIPAERFPDVAPLRQELLADLADCGVDDPRRELAEFFRAPKEWTLAFRPRLVHALAERGRALSSEGRTAAALELWSRALSLEPRSAELRALVDGVARRRRLLGGAAIGLCALALAGAGIAVTHTLSQRARRAHPAPPPTEIAHTVALPSPTQETLAPAENALPPAEKTQPPEKTAPPAHPRVTAPTLKMPAIAAERAHPLASALSRPRHLPGAALAAKRTIDLVPYPRAIHVFIDGQDQGDYTDGKYTIDAGPHTFRLECLSSACFPKTVQVMPEQSRVDVRLEWRPAYLTVTTKPEGADVLVAGLPAVYNDGQPIAIEIPAMSDDGRRTVKVTISPHDKRFASQTLDVNLRAGESKKQGVSLGAPGAE